MGASREPVRPDEAPVIDVIDLDLGGEVVFVTDRDGRIVDVNDAFVRVTGYSRAEAIGSTPALLSSGYQDEAFYEQLWSTISAGYVWEGQMVDRRRDGALRTHHTTITPVRDSSGEITHFVAIERDVTGELGRQVAVGSAGLLHTDAAGRCVYADGRAAALLHRPPSQLLGSGLLSVLEPDDADEFREVVTMAIDEGREHRLDLRSRDGDWLHAEIAPLSVASGQRIGAVCAIEDVSEQVSIHRELARRDAFLTSVLDALEDPVAIVADDGTVLAINAAWRQANTSAPHDPLRSVRVGDDLDGRLEAAAAKGDERARQIRTRLRQQRGGLTDPEVPDDDPLRMTPLRWDEGGLVLRLVAP